MTNPFGVDRWSEAGWGPPTPHQVLAGLMLIAACVALTGVGPGWLTKLCVAITAGSGGAGIASAKNHLSPQILSKLKAVDARALEQPAPQTRIYAATGSDINVTATEVNTTNIEGHRP